MAHFALCYGRPARVSGASQRLVTDELSDENITMRDVSFQPSSVGQRIPRLFLLIVVKCDAHTESHVVRSFLPTCIFVTVLNAVFRKKRSITGRKGFPDLKKLLTSVHFRKRERKVSKSSVLKNRTDSYEGRKLHT